MALSAVAVRQLMGPDVTPLRLKFTMSASLEYYNLAYIAFRITQPVSLELL